MAPSVASIIDLLQRQRLLRPEQLAELKGCNGESPAELVKELVGRSWLTAFQGRQILAGKADRLVLGPYLLLEPLGTGGSGHVFKARHQHMDRIVALKILRGDLLQDADALGRFAREVEVVSQLAHPAIVHAYDAGVVGSTHFLSMEYIDGIDLERHVKEAGPLPVDQACHYIRQAAAGLQYAHERGLVHRDIKPSNLLVAGGSVKILDLGLARLREPAVGSKTKNLTVLAGNSVMLGTPDYMAPEQAVNFHSADIRADIYSLGCTFYFLLTGRPPYSGSLTQKLTRHQQGEIPVVPMLAQRPAIAEILRKMLAKKPADRYQTPAAVADALARLAEQANPPALPGEPKKELPSVNRLAVIRQLPRWKLGIAGSAMSLIAAIAISWWALSGSGTPPPTTAPPPPTITLLEFNGQDQLVTLPDDLFRSAPMLTVEIWFRAAGQGPLLGYQNTALPAPPGQYVPVLGLGNDARLRGQFWDGQVNPVGGPAVNDNRWHHAALVADGKAQTIFLDGEPVGNRPSNALNHLEMSRNQLGAGFTGGWPAGNGNWYHFMGQVAELRVWHRARTVDEIRRDRKRRPLAGASGLAAWYPMPEPTGDDLRDYSSHQRHGKLGGGDPKRQPIWRQVTADQGPGWQ